jgi:YD repeat-containing protein
MFYERCYIFIASFLFLLLILILLSFILVSQLEILNLMKGFNMSRQKYDDNNNMFWEMNPNGKIYEYKYDSNNNLIGNKHPDGSISQYKYDNDKRVTLD